MEQIKAAQHEVSQDTDQTQMEIAMVRNSLIRTEKGSIGRREISESFPTFYFRLEHFLETVGAGLAQNIRIDT